MLTIVFVSLFFLAVAWPKHTIFEFLCLSFSQLTNDKVGQNRINLFSYVESRIVSWKAIDLEITDAQWVRSSYRHYTMKAIKLNQIIQNLELIWSCKWESYVGLHDWVYILFDLVLLEQVVLVHYLGSWWLGIQRCTNMRQLAWLM